MLKADRPREFRLLWFTAERRGNFRHGSSPPQLCAAIALAALHFGSSPPERPVVRFTVAPSSGTLFGPGNAAIRPFPEISPDGKWLAFLAQENNEPARIWVRPLKSTEAHALIGTENAQLPFWSPDSQNIGFFADGKIKRVPVSGGQVQVIHEGIKSAPQGAWGKGGTILFFKENGQENGLYRVHETGGKAVQVTSLNNELKEKVHRAPFFLPDGEHFLYQVQTSDVTSVIYVGSLEPTKPRIPLLIESDSRAVYASPGYILFVRQGNLLAQPFDVKKLEVSGEPFNVAAKVISRAENGRAVFSVSDNGILVYREGQTFRNLPRRVVWIDRSGNPTDDIKNQAGDNVNPRLSPDLKSLVVERRPTRGCTGCSSELWQIDLDRYANTSLHRNLTFPTSSSDWKCAHSI